MNRGVAHLGQPQIVHHPVNEPVQFFGAAQVRRGNAPQLQDPVVDFGGGVCAVGYFELVLYELSGLGFLCLCEKVGLVVQRCFLSPPGERQVRPVCDDKNAALRGTPTDRGSVCEFPLPR